MNVDEFGVTIKTKRDLYLVLTVEAQYFLPSQDNCSLKFLMDIMQGHKSAFLLSEIKHVCVPRLDEFNASEIYNMAMNNPQVRKYLPEPQENERPGARTVSCKFLFTSKPFPQLTAIVVNTVMPEYFIPRIKRALAKRKNRDLKTGQSNKFKIRNDMYELLRSSQHVSKG